MSGKVEQFIAWAESEGAEIEVTQPDDGSGYVVLDLKLPNLWNDIVFDVTVQS